MGRHGRGGANVLVDDDPDAIVSAVRAARFPDDAPELYGDGERAAGSRPLCTLLAVSETWDVAIIGAGYVGLPLAQTFADAGQRVLVLDVVPSSSRRSTPVRATSRTSPSELGAHVAAGRITATPPTTTEQAARS